MTKKAIGLFEFNELSDEHQFAKLHLDGVFVGKRKIANQTIVLFQLYSFYVEVYYMQYRKKIDHIVSSDSTEILHLYLDQVNVEGLNKPGTPE